MDDLKGQYDQAVRERADAFMKAVTIAIIEENAGEYEELKKKTEDFHVSADFQKKKWNLIERLEKADQKKARQKRVKAFGKIAAVILLCLITVCTVLTVTVDAFRFRVFDFLKIDHGEYLELVPVESESIREEDQELFPDNCEGSFYPTILPEGYRLLETFEGGSMEYLTFANGDDEFINLTISPAGKTKTGVDNENVKSCEVDINGIKGYAWEKGDTLLIIWINYEHQFDLHSESLSLPEMLKIAESIKYLKIK